MKWPQHYIFKYYLHRSYFINDRTISKYKGGLMGTISQFPKYLQLFLLDHVIHLGSSLCSLSCPSISTRKKWSDMLFSMQSVRHCKKVLWCSGDLRAICSSWSYSLRTVSLLEKKGNLCGAGFFLFSAWLSFAKERLYAEKYINPSARGLGMAEAGGCGIWGQPEMQTKQTNSNNAKFTRFCFFSLKSQAFRGFTLFLIGMHAINHF